MKAKYDFIILALGNPGSRYSSTRHNVGWIAIDKFIEKHKLYFKPGKTDFYYTEKKYAGKEILIVKPTNYMNNSGLVAKYLKSKLNAKTSDFIILVDEYNFQVGKVHFKKGGSDGGHNGLSSIIYELEATDFWRLRLGIDNKFGTGQLVDYVLSNFDEKEKKYLEIAVNKAVKSLEYIIKFGSQRAMSEINSEKLFEEKNKMAEMQAHWNKAYNTKSTEKLGWYESKSEISLELIAELKLDKNSNILNVGVGSSTLIDDLLELGYKTITATDISQVALNKLKTRLKNTADKVSYICDDLTNPTKLNEIDKVDLWYDRAVLHFFLKENQIENYFNLLKAKVKINGYVLIAEFSLTGAEKCCDLNIKRYNKEMIAERLGDDFQLIKSLEDTYINPYGEERPYVYTVFKRV